MMRLAAVVTKSLAAAEQQEKLIHLAPRHREFLVITTTIHHSFAQKTTPTKEVLVCKHCLDDLNKAKPHAVNGIKQHPLLLLSSCRVDHGGHLAHPIGWKPTLAGMFPHQCLILCNVDTINLVFRYIALYPLDLGTQFIKHTAGLLRNGFEFFGTELGRSWNFSFDEILRHGIGV